MYATGTANGPKALLQALASWCTGAGWTVDNNAAYSGGWWLAVHKGAAYMNFVADSGDTKITLYGATGWINASTAPYSQTNGPGNSYGAICNIGAGPYTGYHFFSDPAQTYLHVVAEKTSGVFYHMHVGQLNAVGGAGPCIYAQVTYWDTGSWASYPDINANNVPWDNLSGPTCSSVGATVDGTFRWFSPYRSSPARAILPARYGFQYYAFLRSPNAYNGLPILLPINVFAERATGGTYAHIGDAPDIRYVNIANNAPKDEITIGADTWKIFPACSKNPNINSQSYTAPSSGNYAFALKKIA